MNKQTTIRYSQMKSLLGDLSKKVVLDIGAGLNPLSQFLKTKKTLILDGSSENNPDICCDVHNGIPLEANSIDVIIAGEFLEHMYNPYKLLSEFLRILKPNGYVVISVPNICSLKSRFKVLFGALPEACAVPSREESFQRHLIDYNLKQLTNMFNDCGFEIGDKRTNGIIFHSKLIFPLFLTPVTFGETLIIKAELKNKAFKYY